MSNAKAIATCYLVLKHLFLLKLMERRTAQKLLTMLKSPKRNELIVIPTLRLPHLISSAYVQLCLMIFSSVVATLVCPA